MNDFSVKSINECVKEELKDKLLLMMILVYSLGILFGFLSYATGNGGLKEVFEFIVSVGLAMVTVLWIAVRTSYYCDAINFPEYFDIESEAFFLFENKMIKKDDFLKKIELAAEKREEFWKNKSYEAWYSIGKSNVKKYGKKRHLERTLDKYPKYLRIEFEAYQYLYNHCDDAIFKGMLDDSKALRQEEVKNAIEKG